METKFMTGSANDWMEDFPHENGNYINACISCQKQFIGYKRRQICKLCSAQDHNHYKPSEDFSVREYQPEDFGLVNGWQLEHGGIPLLPGLFPPVGIVVLKGEEPVCAVWLHLSVGVGVAFVEQPVSKPGMQLADSIEAFSYGVKALEEIALVHDYGVFVVNTLPAIGRILKSFGFERSDEREKVTMFKVLRKEAA